MSRHLLFALIGAMCFLSAFANRILFVHEVEGTGPSHESFCQLHGGRMATIVNQAEQDKVVAFLRDYDLIGLKLVHFGLHRCQYAPYPAKSGCSNPGDRNEYVWSDGKKLTNTAFDAWAPDQPSGKAYPVIDPVSGVYKINGNLGGWSNGNGNYWGLCEVDRATMLRFPTGTCSQPGFLGSYYKDVDVWNDRHYPTGNPDVTRTESSVQFENSGFPSGYNDYFSVKFEAYFLAPTTGTYEWQVKSDDGQRLTIDGDVKQESFVLRPAATDSVSVHLQSGMHYLVYEGFEQEGGSVFSIRWRRPGDGQFSFMSQDIYQQCCAKPDFGAVASPDCDNAQYLFCSAGFTREGDGCQMCPMGTFKALPGNQACLECTGSSTKGATECIGCEPGYTLSGSTCVPCSPGTYKPDRGYHACDHCNAEGVGETYVGTSNGLQSSTACAPTCAAGYDYDVGQCVACRAGKYKSATGNQACDDCGTGTGETFSTVTTTGLTHQSACNPVCDRGYFDDNGACTPCAPGKYKDVIGDVECSSCPAQDGETFESVVSTGLTASDQCDPECDKGYYLNGDACDECPPGKYKSTLGDQQCSPCNVGVGETFSTVTTTGLTASNLCDPVCAAGYYSDNDGECTKCPPGFYKAGAGDGACSACPIETGESYAGTPDGLMSAGACTAICAAGYYLDSETGSCAECDPGSYKTSHGNQACTPCSDPDTGETFDDTEDGLTDPADCDPVCDMGFFRDGASGDCIPCAPGTYKDAFGDDECAPCAALATGESWSTTASGLTASSQCNPVCDRGYYDVSGTCTRCAPGSFKDHVGDDSCSECSLADGETFDTVTADGLTLAAQCDPVCDRGYYGDNGVCKKCVPGMYKDAAGDATCRACSLSEGETFETVTTRGLASLDRCSPVCERGYFDDDGTCTKCAPGTYKDGAGNGQCSSCPSLQQGETWESTQDSLTALANCNPVCNLGYYDNSGTCEQCLPGTFKDAVGDGACSDCRTVTTGETYVTTTPGLTAPGDCEPVCDTGYYDADGTCTLCSAGFYKDTIGDGACSVCATNPTQGVSTAPSLGPNAHWTYDFSVPVTSPHACTWSCDAGYGGPLCQLCAAGEWADGQSDTWTWCKRCLDHDLDKPPNSVYNADGSDPAGQSSAAACEYSCNGEYDYGAGGACDAHPECTPGHFFSDSTRHLPDGSLAPNGSCWEYFAVEQDFTSARATCADHGGDLVHVWTEADNQVLSLARDTYAWIQDEGPKMIHFGLWDRLSESTWTGLDGVNRTEDDFVNWEIDEPTDAELNGEDCAAMAPNGRWFSNPCDTPRPFVCAVPKPPVFFKACNEQQALQCSQDAYCIVVNGVGTCTCPEGLWGDGASCNSDGYTVRFSIWLDGSATVTGGRLFYWDILRDEYASLLTPAGYRTGGSNTPDATRRSLPSGFVHSMEHSVTALSDLQDGYVLVGTSAEHMLTINAIFETKAEADAALEELLFNLEGNHSFTGPSGPSYPTVFGVTLSPDTYPVEPRVYRWVAPSTGSEQQVAATGMAVEAVHFEASCRQSGCWVVDLLITIGTNNFNTLFLPQAVGSDQLSYDFDYTTDDATWGMSSADTFQPNNFPCRSFDYDPEQTRDDDPFHPINAPAEVTSCCLPAFVTMYRPIEGFVDAVSAADISKATCDAGIVKLFSRPNWNPPPPPGPSPYAGDAAACPGTWPAELSAAATCYTPASSAGTISHAYSAGAEAAWLLTASVGASLEVVFDFFETVEDLDWVRLYECNDATCASPTLLAQGSGAYNPFSVVSCTGTMLVTFVSDSASATGLGFMANFYQLPTCPYGDSARTTLRAPTDGSSNDPNRVAHSALDVVPKPGNKLFGFFRGMNDSYVDFQAVEDPYIGQLRAKVVLDQVELRRHASILRGTVGVEHTVDTFIGLANFKPTGIDFLDPFAIQAALHFEQTSFFSVSTHGTNDYTFLEYVNMRLVAIYLEDKDFWGTGESGERTVRTKATAAAHYVQVTFTLGAQYEVNADASDALSGLIPLDSVRAGEGTFFEAATLHHKCLQWRGFVAADGSSYTFDDKPTFDDRLLQDCAPSAAMCASPSSIPDSFVSFNIPLGIDFYDAASADLANNVFVDMVISAVIKEASRDTSNEEPNQGDDPLQMKTTLTASIPVVEGGVNIFCDGFTAKTDLKDVANADIVVGTASSPEELTRLRIKKDITSTQLSGSEITPINSDSIEAGLMTLVLKGNASYFDSNMGRREVTMELEDVITIHIMEADGNGADAGVASSVMGLITAAPDDNTDSHGLTTDGYALNEAFSFTVDRSAQRAHLEPSSKLLAICPFTPGRPSGDDVPLETCVTRRDVRYRNYPWRAGSKSTAMEICTTTTEGAGAGTGITPGSCPSASGSASVESDFFVSILGDSAYARQLAVDFANVIADAYQLNGRYRRAFWINPGYEWTPTQTGGTSIFSVSQKLFLFALITLDEGLATGDPGKTIGDIVGPSLRRRMLLQSTPDDALQDGQASVGAEALEFETSMRQLMAKTFEVPDDRVATFKVQIQLTQAEACMSPRDLQASVRATLDDYLSAAASAYHTAQVVALSADPAGVPCSRRSVRTLLNAFSEASAEVALLVVFAAGGSPRISLAKLQTMPGIAAIEPLAMSPDIVAADVNFAPPTPPPSDKAGSSSVGMIAGAAAGGVALAAVGAMVMVFLRRRKQQEQEVVVVNGINVDDLKTELAADV